MRGAKAKRLRRERPDRPHPGRKSGGSIGKEASALRAEQHRRAKVAAFIENMRKGGKSG